MSIPLLLVIILVVVFLGGAHPWTGAYYGGGPFYGTGFGGGGVLGTILIILVVLWLMGRV